MIYEYKDSNGNVYEKDFPMGEAPSAIADKKKVLIRVFGNSSTIIPEHMKASAENKIRYDRGGRIDTGEKIYY
jgi:hypothetical protein